MYDFHLVSWGPGGGGATNFRHRNGPHPGMGYEAREWACILVCGPNPTYPGR